MKIRTYIAIETPGAITYSTPPAEDDYFTKADSIEDISEQILGLEVSRSPRNFSAHPRLSHPLASEASPQPPNQIDIQPDLTDRYSTAVPCTGLSPGTSNDAWARPNSKPRLSAPIEHTSSETSDDPSINSSHIALAFHQAVEIQAQFKLQEGCDNIVVYQKLSQLAESKRLENLFDLHIALCSFVAMGYKKFLGLKDRETLMTIEILADALKHMGRDEEAFSLYQQAIEVYEEFLTVACQDVCRAGGLEHTHSPPSEEYTFCALRGRLSYSPTRVSLLQCSLVKYLAIEIKNGENRTYNEVADLLSHLRTLYDKQKSRKPPEWPDGHWSILDLSMEKKECKDREAFFSKIAQNSMELALRYYPRSSRLVEMFFPPVLARFKALQPLPRVWISWEVSFYGLYAFKFERQLLRSGKHLIFAFEKLLRRDGIDGLSHPIAQHLRVELFLYRQDLEEELEYSDGLVHEFDTSESGSDDVIDLTKLVKQALASVVGTPTLEATPEGDRLQASPPEFFDTLHQSPKRDNSV
jgi:tetratricopeptide (TPR) repeat protein